MVGEFEKRLFQNKPDRFHEPIARERSTDSKYTQKKFTYQGPPLRRNDENASDGTSLVDRATGPNFQLNRTAAGVEPASDNRPIIIIHECNIFRDCFARCLKIAYPRNEFLEFASVADWINSQNQDSESPEVILFYFDSKNLAAGNDLIAIESVSGDAPVIAMSDDDTKQLVERVIKDGARGFFPTSLPFHIVVEAMRLVLAGGTFIPVSSLDNHVGAEASARSEGLTQRQTMVVDALCKGMANKQIAYQLGMSEHTVKVHIRHIMRKLNAKNRTEVAMRARSFFPEKNVEAARSLGSS